MFKLDEVDKLVIDADLVRLISVIGLFFLIYFFSFQLQRYASKLLNFISRKIGVYSNSKEYTLQRYVYQHSGSFIAKLYRWVNEQLAALSLKRYGVTVTGYLLFWGFIAIITSVVLTIILQFGFSMLPLLFFAIFCMLLVMTRVVVSERMEKREADIMDAIDLIVPEIRNGVKNAIVTYRDNFAPSVKDDFIAFIVNIQDRGYSFDDAMFILADNLGSVFKDFAQKAVYFEAVGEAEMVDIFTDITETNRLRRTLRDENSRQFASLKTTFTLSSLLTGGYFMFIMFTDDFSRNFFLHTTGGKLLLIAILIIVFGVLAFITTIKSRVI